MMMPPPGMMMGPDMMGLGPPGPLGMGMHGDDLMLPPGANGAPPDLAFGFDSPQGANTPVSPVRYPPPSQAPLSAGCMISSTLKQTLIVKDLLLGGQAFLHQQSLRQVTTIHRQDRGCSGQEWDSINCGAGVFCGSVCVSACGGGPMALGCLTYERGGG